MTDSSYDATCIFCRIIAGEIPSKPVLETPHAIVIQDINPQAPVHLLVIPRIHIPSIEAITPDTAPALTNVFEAANQVARERGLEASGFRLVINHGIDGGQSVPHLHVHVLGGRAMKWPPG